MVDEYIKNKIIKYKNIVITVQSIIIALLIMLLILIGYRWFYVWVVIEALEAENEHLEKTIETKNSMIADLEENCKDLFVEIENLKFGGDGSEDIK